MRTIGLIGGLSWESSAVYYRLINEAVRARLGELRSAKSLMYTFDFEEIVRLQRANRWDEATRLLVDAARRLERGGADLLLICSNTMHRAADEVARSTGVPLLHIADATAERVVAQGIGTVGLLGTAYTMEQDFYRGRLRDRHGLTVLVPEEGDRRVVHDVIFRELCAGVTRPESRAEYARVIGDLAARGAQGIVLGCTEIMLLVGQEDSGVPVFDTTAIHAEAAVEAALGPETGPSRAPGAP